MRKLFVVPVALGLSALGVVAVADRAHASSGSANSVITQMTTSYTSPSNKSARVSTLPQGMNVESLCFTEGQTLSGANYWFKIREDGNHLGFVHRNTIGGMPADLPHC